MVNYRVSAAYAKSLIDLAQEQKCLDVVFADMQLISKSFATSFDLRHLMDNPVVGNAKKSEILKAIFADKVNKLTIGFLSLLSSKGRENAIFDVSKEFVSQYKTLNGIQAATITTAVQIDDVLKQQVDKLLAKISDKKLELTTKVDPSIVGGFIVNTGGLQYDASVRTKLTKFKNQFSSNPYISKI
ncbi:MAG: ATP synthase F1 subunit delta [Bacteroidetes bacterium]|nr:MAG: ATP synthase F1 subunit delta [Bacteroidota bacterium]